MGPTNDNTQNDANAVPMPAMPDASAPAAPAPDAGATSWPPAPAANVGDATVVPDAGPVPQDAGEPNPNEVSMSDEAPAAPAPMLAMPEAPAAPAVDAGAAAPVDPNAGMPPAAPQQ